MPLLRRARGLLLVASFTSGACAASPAERAARAGDWPALRAAIAPRPPAAEVSERRASALAAIVDDRELRRASGPDAIDRVTEARSCARELDDALESRARTHDDAGAQAALVRLDEGRMSLDDARAFAADGAPAWRAVAVRAFVRPEDRDRRLRALVDPDPRIRREACRASRDAADPGDLTALVEAARVDPEPIVRTEAVRALAALPCAPCGRVVDELRDLWTSGDDGLREDIADAWASDALWSAGGRDALRHVVASGHGPVVIEAAAAVLRRPRVDAEAAGEAASCLAAAIDEGPRSTRLQALAQAPLGDRDVLAAVEQAARDADASVRVVALGRLAQSGRADAAGALEQLARPGSALSDRALLALARAGDGRVEERLERRLAAARPEARLSAAEGLAALGVAARGASLLADSDADVRFRAACLILAAARRR